MIIITGSLVGTEATIDELIELSLEHVHRSRLEPGCLSHEVACDAENALRLMFTERWADMAAVKTHFAVPASGEFVRAAVALCDAPPTLELYDATPTTVGPTTAL